MRSVTQNESLGTEEVRRNTESGFAQYITKMKTGTTY
jgi:hypothetical protein